MNAPALAPFYRLLRIERIGSTSDEARRLALGGAPEGTLVWAGEQTDGRGRRGRSWNSPPGNLYLSLVLRPGCTATAAAELGFIAAVATGEACRQFLPPAVGLSLKWPNDVLIEGGKTAGILLETQTAAETRLAWVVLGIGVNLVSHPEGTEYPATSLQAAGAGRVTPAVALEALAARFLLWYERWRAEGFAPVRAAWLLRADRLGSEIRVRLPRRELTGRFLGIDEAGGLLLDHVEGCQRIAAAEVFPPRGAC